jgi:hypothetical protein
MQSILISARANDRNMLAIYESYQMLIYADGIKNILANITRNAITVILFFLPLPLLENSNDAEVLSDLN